MARAQSTDFFHSMRFHVDVVGSNLVLGPSAGFSAVTVPEMTVEAVEYHEGRDIYTKKQPGNPTFSEITMSRGVTKADSTFWLWILQIAEGSAAPGDYRVDLRIKHYHRDSLPGPNAAGGNSTVIKSDTGARIYEVYEAFPMRHKVASDLDATASEISIMELDVAFEYFNIIQS